MRFEKKNIIYYTNDNITNKGFTYTGEQCANLPSLGAYILSLK